MLRARFALLAAALPIAGCGLISDFHTAGYSLVDSGSANCRSQSECDAGEVCCVATLSPTTASCHAAPCPNISGVPLPVQLCQGNDECGGTECTMQACDFVGTVTACGAIAMCTSLPDAAPPSALDASAPPFDASLGSD